MTAMTAVSSIPATVFPRRDPLREERLRSRGLGEVLDKVLAEQPLSREDALALHREPSLGLVGYLANLVRERKNGDTTWWVRDQHLNPTNLCKHACLFCAFARRKGQEGGYTMDLDEVRRRTAAMREEGIVEVHVVGGVHPDWGYDDYLAVLRVIRAEHPTISIKGWTAVEVDHMAQLSRLPLERVLQDLRAAGLDHLAGGGAEIFAPEVRKKICGTKASGERWLEVHRTAHALSIPTNSTMLYGHVERVEHRVDHLLALRGVQDEALRHGRPGFTAHIPLAFHPENTFLDRLPGPTPREGLREVAIARLLLDRVPHLKAYWIMLGLDVAQLALGHGADDLHGTVVEERITHMAGGKTEQGLTPARLQALIRDAGRVPVERDGHYRPLRRETARASA